MIHLAIEEPKIEQFFHHSKEEIIKALKFIVENDIKDFALDTQALELSTEQKNELNSRVASFHNDRTMGRSWEEIKKNLS